MSRGKVRSSVWSRVVVRLWSIRRSESWLGSNSLRYWIQSILHQYSDHLGYICILIYAYYYYHSLYYISRFSILSFLFHLAFIWSSSTFLSSFSSNSLYLIILLSTISIWSFSISKSKWLSFYTELRGILSS